MNAWAADASTALRSAAAEFKVAVSRGELGETLIDAGARQIGSIAAGLQIAEEYCMGGLGRVTLAPSSATPRWPWTLAVHSPHPVIACLASQYAGWRLSHGEDKSSYFALGSGPARALARKETLFAEIGYHDDAAVATLVLESDGPPPAPLVRRIAHDCGVEPARRTSYLRRPAASPAPSRSWPASWRSPSPTRRRTNSRSIVSSKASAPHRWLRPTRT